MWAFREAKSKGRTYQPADSCAGAPNMLLPPNQLYASAPPSLQPQSVFDHDNVGGGLGVSSADFFPGGGGDMLNGARAHTCVWWSSLSHSLFLVAETMPCVYYIVCRLPFTIRHEGWLTNMTKRVAD